MNRKKFYIFSVIAIAAIIDAIYYYSGSNDPIPARQRYVDIFDEEPSVSCSNLVLNAWNTNQLAVTDDLKIAINNILHSRGLTSPLLQDDYDEITAEYDSQFKELFARSGNKFYQQCEELYLKFFEECEETNSNQADFLKCWVDTSNSEQQKELYLTLTDPLTLPDVEEEPIDPAPPTTEK